MLRILLSAAVLVAFAGAVHAEDKKSPNGLVCSYAQETGSHIKRRTCETRADAQERRQRDRDAINRAGASQDARAMMSRNSKNPG